VKTSWYCLEALRLSPFSLFDRKFWPRFLEALRSGREYRSNGQ
jgi:hypothetical protein